MVGSSSSSFQMIYDVFLSFRGEDTRNNFTAHLYHALCQKGINTFIDDEKLERGKVISPALVTAIENSMFSIVILSENYASSTWCLEELVKIVECMKTRGQTVLPIFYNIDPSDLRKQQGSFGAALGKRKREHEENLKENIGRVLQTWRAALTEVANLSGWDSRNKQEPMLIKEVVTNILNRLLSITSCDAANLVGIEFSINDVELLFSLDVRMVGIYGIGGIGKTTLAKAIYYRIFNQFEAYAFLEDNGDLNDLREKFLSQLLKVKSHLINDPEPTFIKARLQSKKVLVVIDNVNNLETLEALVGNQNWFGPGSKIIITTRNKHLLVTHGVNEVYEVKKLKDNDALVLFSRYAFKQDHPSEDYVELSERVVVYAQGLPLALKVLGSFVFGKSKLEWESALAKLYKIPNKEIMKVLLVSFDDLDDEEKDIFLDIACFFKGESKDHVIKILDSCDFSSAIGIRDLIDKSLITISNNALWMHDLLQKMGWEIVRQESPKEAGKRSRLWLHEDVYHVLTENTGTEHVEGIFLDLSKLEEIEFNTEAFRRMINLRLLKIYKSRRMDGMECRVHLTLGSGLPLNGLRYLYWHEFPLKIWPPDFHPKYLAQLQMQFSRLEQLWEGNKSFKKLELIELSHSKYLLTTPDFSGVPNLERLILDGCTQLCKVHPSLGFLKKLIFLNLKGCINLTTLPSFDELDSLEVLILSGCSKFNKFPEILGPMKRLSNLYLDGTAINELPSSIENASGLLSLVLEDCKSFKQLPRSICNLKSIKILDVSGCSRLEQLPEDLGKLECLREFYAGRTSVSQAPVSMVLLKNLKVLSFAGCKGAPTSSSWGSYLSSWLLPTKSSDSIGFCLPPLLGFCNLAELDISDCNMFEVPADIGSLSSLAYLNLSGNNFFSLPSNICQLLHLRYLGLSHCKRLQVLPMLPPCTAVVDAHGCESLEMFYFNPSIWTTLHWFRFTNCFKLKIQLLQSSEFLVAINLAIRYLNPAGDCQSMFAPPDLHKTFSALLSHRLFQEADYADWKRRQKVHYATEEWKDVSHCQFEEADYIRDPELGPKAHALLSHRLRLSKEADYEDWERRLKAHERRPKVNPSWTFDNSGVQFSMFVGGSEIPKWFAYQGIGSSLNIEVDQEQLEGLAVCAVFELKEACYGYHSRIECCLSDEDVGSFEFTFQSLLNVDRFGVSYFESDHLWLGFDTETLIGFQKTSRRFRAEFDMHFLLNHPKNIKIKSCGIHPFYKNQVFRSLDQFREVFEDLDTTEASGSGRACNLASLSFLPNH